VEIPSSGVISVVVLVIITLAAAEKCTIISIVKPEKVPVGLLHNEWGM